MPVKPSYLALAGAGAIVAVSGLKGWGLGHTFRDLVAGQKPGQQDIQLTSAIHGATFYGYGGGTYGGGGSGGSGGTGTGIPPLGTTLPPQSVMDKYFGPINSPLHERSVNFAGHRVTVNRVLANNVYQAGQAVLQAGLAHEIRDIGGFRMTKGASGAPIPYSMHQYGAAFDINEDGGPNGNWNTMTLDPRLVGILYQFGWFCGENWSGASRDGGHFQFMGG